MTNTLQNEAVGHASGAHVLIVHSVFSSVLPYSLASRYPCKDLLIKYLALMFQPIQKHYLIYGVVDNRQCPD
jgi:hypothetical protein